MEEEARQKAEEERIKAAREEEARINKQAEDAFAIIGDLDNALKGFTETLGLSDVIECMLFHVGNAIQMYMAHLEAGSIVDVPQVLSLNLHNYSLSAKCANRND